MMQTKKTPQGAFGKDIKIQFRKMIMVDNKPHLNVVKKASSLEDAAREAETILRMNMFAEIPFLKKKSYDN